jgi:hypothetical protein
VTGFRFEIQLMECLNASADSLANIGVEPLFLSECPNKFNDAHQDDLWYAVQAGTAYWEQSHFFEYGSEPFVREHATYPVSLDIQDIKQSGATVASDQISHLREKLRWLQKEDWRGLCDWDGLAALVIERGQRWLVLEYPNSADGNVYSWDDMGMFHVGTVDRIDQRVGKDTILLFKTITANNIERLGGTASRFFKPHLQDEKSGETLARLLWDIIQRIRTSTNTPFAMRSRNSRETASDSAVFQQPQTYSKDLRHKEGEWRKPTNDKWPLYRENFKTEPTEYSDLAKLFHTCLGQLEDADWRGLFGTTFGETLEKGQHLSLYADATVAVLMRDNTAFKIMPTKLGFLGAFDYPNLWHHEDVIQDLEQGHGQRR